MNPDDRLNSLFSAAREDPGAPGDFGFETRLRASLRAARSQPPGVGLLAWRLVPAFAAIALFAAAWSHLTPNNAADLTVAGLPASDDLLLEIVTTN